MSHQATAKDAATNAEEVVHQAAEVLQGRVPNTDGEKALGHPVHPAFVHWPIAFLSVSFGLTSLTLLPLSLQPTNLIPSLLPPAQTFPALAHYSAVAGVLTAIPAIVTGLGEAYEMVRTQIQSKGSLAKVVDDAWNVRDIPGKKLKMTSMHAAMNDLVVIIAGLNAYHGWKYPDLPLPKLNTYASAVVLPILLLAASIGGKLVYEYGFGVQRQGTGKEIKEKDQ